MELTELEDQIIKYLETRYKHSINKDDPLMLTISAQVKVTEHLLDLHKENIEAEFENFKLDLSDLLKDSQLDAAEGKQIISEYVRKTFLAIADSYKQSLNAEFIRAGQEYEKARTWYKLIKFWSLGTIGIFIIGLIFITAIKL